jgi:hypothetical protein
MRYCSKLNTVTAQLHLPRTPALTAASLPSPSHNQHKAAAAVGLSLLRCFLSVQRDCTIKQLLLPTSCRRWEFLLWTRQLQFPPLLLNCQLRQCGTHR